MTDTLGYMRAKPLRQNSFTLILLAILFSQIAGCVCPFRQDVTDNPKFKTDYARGQIYTMKKPFFLCTDPSNPELWLYNIGGVTGPDIPATSEEYYANPAQWREVRGIVKPGTKIMILKIERGDNVEMGWEFYVEAKILDGDFASQMVEVSLISRFLDKGEYPMLPVVNTQCLELETSTNLTR
jgi:hypothetical protein